MQGCEASDGVVSTDANTTTTATRMRFAPPLDQIQPLLPA
jgi:hypothetical protein